MNPLNKEKVAVMGLSLNLTLVGVQSPDSAFFIAPKSPLAIPGLSVWALDCRLKTLRGIQRGWLLNSGR
jgi:hypothetical protein